MENRSPKIWSKIDLFDAKTDGHDGLCSRDDTFDAVSCNERVARVNQWVEECSWEEKELLRTLTRDLSPDQLAEQWKVSRRTIDRRLQSFCRKARWDLKELAHEH